jgi:hypothetical protein
MLFRPPKRRSEVKGDAYFPSGLHHDDDVVRVAGDIKSRGRSKSNLRNRGSLFR